MGRRRSGSLVEDVITIAAKLPWPVGVTLAVVAFVGFGILSDVEPAVVARPTELDKVVVPQLAKFVSTIFQWLIPSLLLIGSAASAFKRHRRVKLYGEVVAAGSPSSLSRMSWQDFERLVSDYFQRRGFKVVEFGGHGSDGGIDLIARRGDDEYVIQCKQWKAYRVGVVPVRELYGLVSKRRAAGGFVVTSGSFTDEAIRFVSGISVELIDGAKLASAIARLERAPSLSGRPPEQDESAALMAPRCPSCRGEMVLRTARTEQHAGSQFWGCARYPKCRGTRSIT